MENRSGFFEGFAYKKLANVDTIKSDSHQHEITCTVHMKKFFGTHAGKMSTTYKYLNDNDRDIVVSGSVSYYDARLNDPNRSENRLYYETNQVTLNMKRGDLMLLSRSKSNPGNISFIVAAENSLHENEILKFLEIFGD